MLIYMYAASGILIVSMFFVFTERGIQKKLEVQIGLAIIHFSNQCID